MRFPLRYHVYRKNWYGIILLRKCSGCYNWSCKSTIKKDFICLGCSANWNYVSIIILLRSIFRKIMELSDNTYSNQSYAPFNAFLLLVSGRIDHEKQIDLYFAISYTPLTWKAKFYLNWMVMQCVHYLMYIFCKWKTIISQTVISWNHLRLMNKNKFVTILIHWCIYNKFWFEKTNSSLILLPRVDIWLYLYGNV